MSRYWESPLRKLHRGVVALGVSAVVAAALVAPGVQVTGTSTGMGLGAILRPMLRFPGQLAYTQGFASILVDQAGAFDWQRRTGEKTYVYVVTPGGTARSNRVIIPAQ